MEKRTLDPQGEDKHKRGAKEMVKVGNSNDKISRQERPTGKRQTIKMRTSDKHQTVHNERGAPQGIEPTCMRAETKRADKPHK